MLCLTFEARALSTDKEQKTEQWSHPPSTEMIETQSNNKES